MTDEEKKAVKRAAILFCWLVVIFGLAWALAGCAGARHCISIGGEWEGKAGNIEYCFSVPESREAGMPAFEGKGGKAYLVKESEIEEADKALAKAEEILGLVGIRAASAAGQGNRAKGFFERARRINAANAEK